MPTGWGLHLFTINDMVDTGSQGVAANLKVRSENETNKGRTMTQAMRVTADNNNDISTILSERVLIPVGCDHCDKETEVSLETLKSTSTVMCEHCCHVRPFSNAEMNMLMAVLGRAGYRVP